MSIIDSPGRISAPVSDLDPFSDEFLFNPYPAHSALRDQGAVVWLERYQVWAMARHFEVAAGLNDYKTYCSSAGVGLSDFRKNKPWRVPSLLIEADPPKHTIARTVITGVLTPALIRTLHESFLEVARAIVDTLIERGSFDGVADLAEAFPLKVFPDVVGIPADGRENLLPYGSMVFNGFGPRNQHFERAMASAEPVSGWILASCERENLTPGGLGAQIHERAAEAGYGPEDAARIVRSLLSAGVDTTVHGIGNMLYALASHPEQYAALRMKPSLIRPAFEETIRWESPVQTFFRTTTRQITVADVVIQEGEKVLLFLGAANRDERRWGADADRFDITRKSGGHTGFGVGVHACVGQMIARLEAEVVLTALTERVSALALADEPERQLNNTLRGLSTLPLTVTA